MKNKFRENTSEIKITLMSKAFIPANQHIMSFVYDTHPLSLKPVELNGYIPFAEEQIVEKPALERGFLGF